MPIEASAANGIVEVWRYLEGSGSSVAGMGASGTPKNLALTRTDFQTGNSAPVNDGWFTETLSGGGTRKCFNGLGTVDPGSGVLSLSTVGQGVTIAARWTMNGWSRHAYGTQWSDSGGGGTLQVFGLSGEFQANPVLAEGLWLEFTFSNIANWHTFHGSSGDFDYFAPNLNPAPTGGPVLAVWSATRQTSTLDIVMHLAAGQKRVQQVPWSEAQHADLRKLCVGDIDRSNGCVSQAALWNRALTDAEVVSLGNDLDGLVSLLSEGGGPGSANPLLNADGTSRISPRWPCRRVDLAGVLASEGHRGRQTRLVHERAPRVYELGIPAGSADADAVREALAVTRGGAGSTRWRHPADDTAGPVSTAPRFRIRNAEAAHGGVTVERNAGGNAGEVVLVLEEL